MPSSSSAEAEYDDILDTPELLPGTSASHPYETLSSVAEHAIPELAYDSASPASINLPDPQDSGYLPSTASSSYANFELSPQGSIQSLPDHALAAASHPSHAHDAPNPNSYTASTFSTLTSWDSGTHTNEPAYYHFPYFAARYGSHTDTGNNAIDTSMDFNNTHPNSAAVGSSMIESPHPYASSIPPFELHRRLKSFEQPFPYEFSELPIGLHTFGSGSAYLDPIF
jgi:hypothetical protein